MSLELKAHLAANIGAARGPFLRENPTSNAKSLMVTRYAVLRQSLRRHVSASRFGVTFRRRVRIAFVGFGVSVSGTGIGIELRLWPRGQAQISRRRL
jgi:hypothetical protein